MHERLEYTHTYIKNKIKDSSLKKKKTWPDYHGQIMVVRIEVLFFSMNTLFNILKSDKTQYFYQYP